MNILDLWLLNLQLDGLHTNLHLGGSLLCCADKWRSLKKYTDGMRDGSVDGWLDGTCIIIYLVSYEIIRKLHPDDSSEPLQPHHIFGRIRGNQQMDSAGDQLQS